MKDKTIIIASILLGTIIGTSSYVVDELPEDVSYSEQFLLSKSYDPDKECVATFDKTLLKGKTVPILNVTSDNNATVKYVTDNGWFYSEVFKDLKCS